MVFALAGWQHNKKKAMIICILDGAHLCNPQEEPIVPFHSFVRNNPEYRPVGARGNSIPRKSRPQFVAEVVFLPSNLSFRTDSAPRIFILRLLPDSHALKRKLLEDLRILIGSPNLVQVVNLYVWAFQKSGSLCST
jgi:hypothetical protein